ncbi:DUF1206 domain-containing protein [Caulobacter hibisci]|uniref:DUF1206 domain-containing protein n=1 Tax=Caulobacter hibisci TaxID=2035993 RepID=A0ABS0T2T7_9CAUL|nr:DUF1206 domain-containing protein [Caulobacter hibisci]MBI1686139.1 DUF1206 domain-containing protein [Caulobacter hibisci]
MAHASVWKLKHWPPKVLRGLDLRTALEWASRLGYAARGAVYVGLGGLALLAATDLAPRARGAKAMLAAWAQWPPGLVLIALVAAGLAGFAVWRGLQAGFDADRHGTSPKAWAVRAGQAVSGLVYGSLAWSALELLDEFEDVGEADEEQTADATAASILALPHGDLLLLLAGLVLLGVGIGGVVQGLAQDFAKRLDCGEAACRRLVPLARFGYAARGLATLSVGLFVVGAGWHARSSEARSWAGALQALERQPFGSWLLAGVALGLVAFGVFGFGEAVWRKIRPPAEIG